MHVLGFQYERPSQRGDCWLIKLPIAEQELAAEAILALAHRGGRSELSEEQAEDVLRRLADPKPKFLTLAEARARLLA